MAGAFSLFEAAAVAGLEGAGGAKSLLARLETSELEAAHFTDVMKKTNWAKDTIKTVSEKPRINIKAEPLKLTHDPNFTGSHLKKEAEAITRDKPAAETVVKEGVTGSASADATARYEQIKKNSQYVRDIGKKVFGKSKVLGQGISRNFIGKALTSPKMMAPAIVVGFATGLVYGAGRTVLQRVDQRTQKRGMAGNNMGTDGLTLALSRTRHR